MVSDLAMYGTAVDKLAVYPRQSSTGPIRVCEYVSASLRRLIAKRANQRCEYCLIDEDDVFLPHEPDHVVAVKHRGETVKTNLVSTCLLFPLALIDDGLQFH